jgi:predicted Holliday junction resolvase-like endonuclease
MISLGGHELSYQSVVLIALGILLVIFSIKPLLWWLFSFDSRVRALLEQKKSSEVRLGKISETLAPVLNDFPVDVHKPGTSTIFLGQPVDFIHFDPESGVSFIEVKSGESKLSSTQKKLKNLIQAGKVGWLEFRVKG